jgi:transcriptional regulator with XRE-family HTH domain
MEFSAEGNVKIIFGLKVRKLRSDARLSLQQLSERTGISVSYLNEIEKGKKYPKSDKIADLARALGVGYDHLISQKLNKNLAPVGEILALDVFSDLPFDNFGIDRNVLFGMIANAPAKMAAFVNTIIEVARYYNLKQEHFYFSCLRSLQEMTDNHFEELEMAADQFIHAHPRLANGARNEEIYRDLLEQEYGYLIEESDFADYPQLAHFRSVLIPGPRPRLMCNKRLSQQQRLFLYGRELGFNYLKLEKRPFTTSWLKVESFEHVYNNFRASYFAQALHLHRPQFQPEMADFFARDKWEEQIVLSLLEKFQASPEMFAQRFTNLAGRYFGMEDLFLIRFSGKEPERNLKEISKELHLVSTYKNFEQRLAELSQRRSITRTVVRELERRQSIEPGRTHALGLIAQGSGNKSYFILSVLRPRPELQNQPNSITLGFEINTALRLRYPLLQDPELQNIWNQIPKDKDDSSELLHRLKKQKLQEAAFEQLRLDLLNRTSSASE